MFMKKVISTILAFGIAFGTVSFGASATSCQSVFSGTQDIPTGKSVSIYFTASSKPNVSTGNPQVATVSFLHQDGNKYYYQLAMKGATDSATGIYANNALEFIARATSASYTCSISGTKAITTDDTFTFTVTSPVKPVIGLGSSTMGLTPFVSQSGNTYTYRFYTHGNTGSTGVYVNGSRAFVISISDSDSSVVSVYSPDVRTMGQAMIAAANAERAKVGVAPLIETSALDQVSDIRAKEASVLYQHGRPNGKSWDELEAMDGVNYSLGEVLCVGGDTNNGTDAIAELMSDGAHEYEVLSGDCTHVGASYFDVGGNRYFEMVFDQE